MLKKTKLWTALTGVFSLLLTIVLVIGYFGNSYATMINKVLGVTSSRIIDNEGGSEDSQYYKSDYLKEDGTRDDDALTEAQKALCEQIQGEGAVLVKNDGTLPVAKGVGVSCFGRASVDLIYGGTGSGQVDTSNAATMESSLTDAGFQVNSELFEWYSDQLAALQEAGTDRSTAGMWTDFEDVGNETRIAEIPAEDIAGAGISYEGYSDLAIVTFGRSGGEGSDLAVGQFTDGENYFELQEEEKELLKYVKDQGFDKIVVLINSSNAMSLNWLDEQEYGINACLWIGGPGQYGMNAVAEILNGDINPSGRFVDTYAASSLSSPAMQNFGGFTYANADSETGTVGGETIDGQPGDNSNIRYAIHYLIEAEGIYVGYKYYETRYEDVVLNQGNADGSAGVFMSSNGNWNYSEEVDYPFGYGLSYTNFEQVLNGVRYDEDSDTYQVTVTVTNTGDVAGKDVVQVYAQQPYTEFDTENGIEKSAVQLAGFGKTQILEPGENETLTVEVEREELASYDAKVNKTYIVENGDYYLAIGDNAHDALNNILAAKGKTVADGMDADGEADKSFHFEVTDEDDIFLAYSQSDTGYDVTNQFDSADLNYYGEGLVTYLTRSDWEGTFPAPYDNLTATEDMIHDLQFNYEPGEASEEIITGSKETNYTLAQMKDSTYDDERWEDLLNQLTIEDMAEIVGHSGYGTQSIASVGLDATVTANGPQGISGTHEGETTVAYTSEVVMASTFNSDLIYELGLSMGEDALRADTKIVGWYGPAMNIHRTPYGGRNYEYYSEDAYLSAVMAAVEIKGAQEKGIVAYAKHFALNDQETYRQSVATFANEQAIREIYLKPFQAAVEDGGSKGIMSSFNRVGFRWAGAHKGLMTEVLRNEWGFEGSSLTDAVMANRNWMDVRIGVEAGNDTWLSSGYWLVPKIIAWAEEDGKFLENLRESCHRFLYSYCNSSAINGMSTTATVEKITPAWQTTVNSAEWILGILAAASFVLTILATVNSRKNKA